MTDSRSYLVYALEQMVKNTVNRNQSLPTSQTFLATWNGAEASDSNLSNISLQGGGTARFVPKLAHVTGLVAGDRVLVEGGGVAPMHITGKIVGDIRLALYSGDVVPPSGVGSITQGTTTISSIQISWSAATDNIGVAGYNVFQDGVFLGLVGPTTFNVTGLTSSTSYLFKVQAVDYAGNLGAASQATFTTSVDTSHGTFTKTYTGIWSATYSAGTSNGPRITSLGNTMAQGYSGGAHRLGCVQFNAATILSDLAGATLNAISFKMTVSAAPTGFILLSSMNSPSLSVPSTRSAISTNDEEMAYLWSTGQTKTLTLNPTFYDPLIRAGNVTGFCIGDQTSTSSSYIGTAYGYAGGVYAPALILTYTK